MEEPDLYTILRVSPTANREDIRRAYRALVREYHPDLHEPRDGAAARAQSQAMSAILHAYAVLADPDRRADYDRQRGNADRAAQQATHSRTFQDRVRSSDGNGAVWTLRPEDVVRIFPPESPLHPPQDVFEILIRRWFLR